MNEQTGSGLGDFFSGVFNSCAIQCGLTNIGNPEGRAACMNACQSRNNTPPQQGGIDQKTLLIIGGIVAAVILLK